MGTSQSFRGCAAFGYQLAQVLIFGQMRLSERGAKEDSPIGVICNGLRILRPAATELLPALHHNALFRDAPLQEASRCHSGNFALAGNLRNRIACRTPYQIATHT